MTYVMQFIDSRHNRHGFICDTFGANWVYMTQADEKLYEALFMNSQKGGIVFDLSGQIIDANPKAELLFGYSKSELKKKNIEDIINKNLHVQLWAICRSVMQGQRKTEEERLLTINDHNIDGQRYVLGMYFNNHITAADGTILFAAVIIDETQKWKNKHELVESLERFRKTFHSNPVAQLIVTAADKTVIDVNGKFLQTTGYTRDEVIGSHILSIGVKLCVEDEHLPLGAVSGPIGNCETILHAKSGRIIDVHQSYVAINVNDVPHELWTFIDLADRKIAENNLKQMNEDLERKVRERTRKLTDMLEREKSLNDLKTRFISMASHEFRTPLTTILVSTGLLETHIERNDPDKCAKHISRIKSSVKLLTEILEDFLSLDKIENGQIKPNYSVFHLKDFAESVIDKLQPSLKKGQTIEYDLSVDDAICQDKRIMQGIVLNLLSNAIKYSGEGQVINLSLSAKKGKIVVSVVDKGIGIPADEQVHIFSRFFRARNAETIQGTGLGLNIIKNYTKLLKGKITFVSTENAGTKFTLEVPWVAEG